MNKLNYIQNMLIDPESPSFLTDCKNMILKLALVSSNQSNQIKFGVFLVT